MIAGAHNLNTKASLSHIPPSLPGGFPSPYYDFLQVVKNSIRERDKDEEPEREREDKKHTVGQRERETDRRKEREIMGDR